MSHSKLNKTFLEEVFAAQASSTTYSDELEALICDEAASQCHDFDLSKIQDSWSWRNVHIGRELANLLIDDKGEIQRRILFRAIQLLEKNLFSLGPDRYHDATRQKHLLQILKLFYENPDFPKALKRISHPIGNAVADKIIRETLSLPENSAITDAVARRAALSTVLTTLRQNVGSCFATAPAILIQQELPLRLLDDLGQLLGTGRLHRVYEGAEYVVPLSISWGMGDLLRPIPVVSLGNQPHQVLALSPGLQAAFIAAGLIDQHANRKERIDAVAHLLSKSALQKLQGDLLFFATADQLIKKVLLDVFEVTQADVDAFAARATVQGPLAHLVAQAPASLGSKSLNCTRYLKAYEEAKRAFKAFCDNALLKAWEFTLASLSESQADFAKWNLYISLGVNPEDPHGIGESLYKQLQQMIESLNDEIQAFQSNYDHLYAQAKYLEGRINQASSEREVGWIRAEYQLRRNELNRALGARDEVYEKGRKLQGLYPQLIEFYGKKIREYFQEVYDAQMHDVTASPYDDSPAGFRLMYKYGRAHTSLWSMIYTPEEYIQHLISFFVSTEVDLIQQPAFEDLQKEVSELVTTVITTIKRPEFLESSFVRLAKAYHEPLVKDPLAHLDLVKRKPWSYVSGGTMATLVKYYWGAPQEPKEAKRWMESENEYLAFVIDTLKDLPMSVQRSFQDNPNKNMLAISPTHAFLCKPGWPAIRKAWESDEYAYTWIKERWLAPQHHFLADTLLDTRMMETLIDHLLLWIPEGYRAVARHALSRFPFSMTPPEFHAHVIQALSYEKWLKEGHGLALIAEELDSLLYQFLPLFPEHQLPERLATLFEAIDELDEPTREALKVQQYPLPKYQILTARDLRETAQALLISALKSTRSPIFFTQKIVQAMRQNHFCYPEPLLFADTNWVNNVFGFVLNPGTNTLEFWRFDDLACTGRPISAWKRYLNGLDPQPWSLYTNPSQYSS